MVKVVKAFRWGKAVEGLAQETPQTVHGRLPGTADEPLEFRVHHLDGIEIRTVGRKVNQRGSGGFDRLPDSGCLMAGEVIHDDDVGWSVDART